jgi:isopentenyl diphosphate isomerase/L-lactate dehydrogenase-like FMN-dependent dehydrogenase
MSDTVTNALNIADLREMSRSRLPRFVFEWLDRGAEDEVALRNNRQAFENIKIQARVLRNVSTRTLETKLFGKTFKMPYGVSPTGTAGLLAFGGEIGVAKAAARAGVPCAVGTNAQTAMEDIIEQAGGDLWFQLYIWSDKEMSRQLVERVKSAGYEILIVTVDGPVGPNREYNKKNGFSMPVKYTPRLIAQLLAKPGWLMSCLLQSYIRKGTPKFENYPPELMDKVTAKTFKKSILKSDALDWDDVRRLRDMWPGKLLVKGIVHPEDAMAAAECGADGVIISNHGGRYLDASVAPIQVLPEIAKRVGGKIAVIMDSGVRRGSDVIKAVALGADLVMAGRPTLYGVGAGGEAGADRALEIFHDEIDRVMAQLGLHSVEEVTPDCLWQPNSLPAIQLAAD